MKKPLYIASILGGLVTLTIASIMGVVQFSEYSNIYAPSEATIQAPTAIILGASVLPNHTPSDALRDRLLVGIRLYHSRQVQQLLVSGDNGEYHANEVDTMKQFLLDHDVAESDILVDGRGFRTYESCKRAVSVFQLQSAIIVTQRFHMARALYVCDRLGLSSVGVTSDLQPYQKIVYFWVRDLLASVKAWWDINISPPPSPVNRG